MKVAIAVLFAFLVGCSTLGDGSNPAAVLAIKYATLKVIEKADAPSDKAQRIIAVATDAKSLVASGEVTAISTLEQAVRAKINWSSLDAADTLLADTLITAVRLELESRVEGGSLSDENLLAVSVVLDNIIAAAKLYV